MSLCKIHISNKILLIVYIISILLIMSLFGFLTISNYEESAKLSLERYQKEKLRDVYSLISDRVINIKNNINQNIKDSEKLLKESLKSRLDNAFMILESSSKFIGENLKEVLRDIRWSDGKGYYFIDDIYGNCILYPIRPSLEGKNVINIQDINGKFVIKDFIDIIKNNKEGYSTYLAKKPNSPKKYKKISIIREYKPFNWIIGTGAYIDDFIDELKLEWIDRLKNITFDNQSKILLIENNISIVGDINISNINLGFNANKNYIQYFDYVEELQWYIGIQYDTKEIDNINKKEIDNINRDIESKIEFFEIIFLLTTLLSIGISYTIFTFQNRLLIDRNRRIIQKKELFTNMFYKNSAVMLLIDCKTFEIIDCNTASLIFYGENLKGESLRNIDENPTRFNKVFQMIRDKKRTYFISKHKIADGSVADVQIYITPICSDNKNKLFAIIHDVTTKTIYQNRLKNLTNELSKRVEDEIKTRLNIEMIFSNITNLAFDGIVTIDSELKIKSWSKACEDIFGYSKKEILDKVFTKYIIAKENQKQIEKILNIFFARDTDKFKGRILTLYMIDKSKKEIIIEASLSLAIIESKKSIIAVLRNITAKREDEIEKKELKERQKAQERLLIQQSKMADLGEMIGSISHQWKQPLNSIALMVQSLDEEEDISPKHLDYVIDSVLKQVNFMSHTIDDFRRFFIPSKEMINFNLISAINEIISIVEFQFSRKQIEIEILSTNDIFVNGFKNEFKQVVLNILNNSKDALDENKIVNGKITIDILENSDYIDVIISDNANGIDKSLIKDIFKPFVTTKGDNGTGIGLYMSKTIMNNMNGDILVKNLNDGAEFTIRFKKEII